MYLKCVPTISQQELTLLISKLPLEQDNLSSAIIQNINSNTLNFKTFICQNFNAFNQLIMI